LFGIGGFELFLILLFGFLIFGPDKLPAMAKTLGKAIAKFRSAQDEMNKVIKEEKIFDPDAEDPFKNPLDALEKMGNAAESGAKNVKKAATSTVNAAKNAKQESFSERKARYDRERAARKEAEKAEAEKQAAILLAEAEKEKKIREGQGEAESIMLVQKAQADAIRLLNEACPSREVLTLKAYESFMKAADGQATKIIIPSEIQGMAGLAASVKELVKE